ncbi:unnamed protein product [Choristocarpus tenellus]
MAPFEGEEEACAVRLFVPKLDRRDWRVFVHERLNWPNSPTLFTIYKI